MNGNRFKLLKTDIQIEIGYLSRLIDELRAFMDSLERKPYYIELRALGSILHDFYCGTEKVFEKIAIGLDGEMPKGTDWHTQLLIRMGSEIEDIRPAVINKSLQNQLKEYLRFRHLFRNIYGFELEWDKMQGLVNSLPEIFTKFQSIQLLLLKNY